MKTKSCFSTFLKNIKCLCFLACSKPLLHICERKKEQPLPSNFLKSMLVIATCLSSILGSLGSMAEHNIEMKQRFGAGAKLSHILKALAKF